MKRPAKTATELEAMIRAEMEYICAWPLDMAVSVHPEGDTWKADIMQERRKNDDGLAEVLQTIVHGLREEFDLQI